MAKLDQWRNKVVSLSNLPTQINGESIASFLSQSAKTERSRETSVIRKISGRIESLYLLQICYYCTKKNFQSKAQYERHVIRNHKQNLAYPNLPYLKAMNLKPQGCLWEE